MTQALIFSFFMTLLCALIFGETLEFIFYAVFFGISIPFASFLSFYVSQQQNRAENQALTRLSTAVSIATTTHDIDRILINEVKTLVPVSAEAAILELKPSSDHIELRSGVYSEKKSMNWLQFEKQTEDLVELHNCLFIRLCSRGERTLFLVVQHKKRFLYYFRVKRQRLLSLRAVARTAYEKQFLVEGLTIELEDFLSESPNTSAKMSRLAFELGERERSRLALDLHDTALQDQLFWHRHMLELLEDDQLAADMKSKLTAVSEGMLDVVFRIREICTELKPRIESQNSLHNRNEAIASTFDELIQKTRLRSDFKLTFDISNFDSFLTHEELLILYRIVQELMHNATKHSKAKHVDFRLESGNDLVSLRYFDDGIGVEMNDSAKSFSGMGLSGIKERSKSLAGISSLDSLPGQGLRFELHFRPLKKS